MRTIRLFTLALFLSSCGGGGDDGPSTGSLVVSNSGSSSAAGECRQQFTVTPAEGGAQLFTNVGPCGQTGYTLEPGLYNVTACSPGGACSASDCFQETIAVNAGEVTNFPILCGACERC